MDKNDNGNLDLFIGLGAVIIIIAGVIFLFKGCTRLLFPPAHQYTKQEKLEINQGKLNDVSKFETSLQFAVRDADNAYLKAQNSLSNGDIFAAQRNFDNAKYITSDAIKSINKVEVPLMDTTYEDALNNAKKSATEAYTYKLRACDNLSKYVVDTHNAKLNEKIRVDLKFYNESTSKTVSLINNVKKDIKSKI